MTLSLSMTCPNKRSNANWEGDPVSAVGGGYAYLRLPPLLPLGQNYPVLEHQSKEGAIRILPMIGLLSDGHRFARMPSVSRAAPLWFTYETALTVRESSDRSDASRRFP